MRILFFLLLLPLFSGGQIVLSGKVVEENTLNPIPYATIGLVMQNVGTNANEKGEFKITCRQPDLDSLIISCIGYATILLPVNKLQSLIPVKLNRSKKLLKTVYIKNQWNTIEVGSHNGNKNNCFITNGYQWQVAKKFSAPFANTYLKTIHVQTSRHYNKSIFRVHVYDIDSLKKGPGKELTDTVIQVTSDRGISSIDMTPYLIWLSNKEYFISIEWLFITSNEKRSMVKYQGKRKELIKYAPCICIIEDASAVPSEIWGLSYSGKWFPGFSTEHSFNIAVSATLKY
jgi:hypothetical protein